MNDSEKRNPSNPNQVMYNGRWVDRAHFRAVVYNDKGEEKIVNSWDEYQKEIESGVWKAENDETQGDKLRSEKEDKDSLKDESLKEPVQQISGNSNEPNKSDRAKKEKEEEEKHKFDPSKIGPGRKEVK